MNTAGPVVGSADTAEITDGCVVSSVDELHGDPHALPLAEDGPQPEHCGSCTACLEACPTDAFTGPRELDARKCIAYLTVEHRSEIAKPLHQKMGTMVAGCDICQEVCPWTRRASADLHPEFAPAPHRFRPRLDDLEGLDEEGYREWRRGSSLNRISYTQFRRNLAIARANRR